MFLTVRHFSDQNALRSFGHDGPLKTGQDSLIAATAEKIMAELLESRKKSVRILYTAKTRRISETAHLIANSLRTSGVTVVFQHDVRLEVMDQGDLILPDSYQDGEWFDPLDAAWDAICEEAYSNHNIFYRFGDSLGREYPALEKGFSRLGESLGWSLINKYSLIHELSHGRLAANGELSVIVAQSDLPLILMELQILEGHPGATLANLPYKCWEVYKNGLQEQMYDRTATGCGNFDIPMGYVERFDLSSFLESGFDRIIKKAGLLLAGRR